MINFWNSKAMSGLLQFSTDMICTIDANGKFVHVSAACLHLLEYSPEELLGRSFLEFVHPSFISKTQAITHEIIHDGKRVIDFKNIYLKKSGEQVCLSWSAVYVREHQCMYCVARLNEPELPKNPNIANKEELLSSLLDLGTDMQSVLSESGHFLYSSGSTEKTLGYSHEEILGQNAFELVHPGDLEKVKEAWQKVLAEGYASVAECRIKHANGNWLWLELMATNQLQNPEVKGVLLISRDKSEWVTDRLLLQESEQRFRALFMNLPDLLIYQNRNGIILDVNEAVLSYFEAKREEVVGHLLFSFLPPEVHAICRENLDLAFGGEVVQFELEINFEWLGLRTFEVTKIPVKVNSEVVGVYSRLNDVSEVVKSNQVIRKQTQRLTSVLESITDAFFLIDRNNRFAFINHECENILQIDRNELLGRQISEVFPKQDIHDLFQKYQKSLEAGESVYFEWFHPRLQIWLEVKIYPSEEGLSVYFSDITEKINAKRELEQLSLVASKTINSVVITNAEGYVEWVNEAFMRITGYSLAEVKDQKPGHLLQGPETDPETVERFREKLAKGESFNESIVNYRKNGEKFWLSMDITPIRNREGKTVQFIAIQKDITERKEIEVSQRQMTQDLFRQNRDLQQFTYIISHNLRAPVANALGLADLLTKLDKNTEGFDNSLSYLKQTVFKMDTVLRDLNLVLTIRNKQDMLEQEKVDLANVIEQVLLYFQEQLTRCAAQVNLEIARPLFVTGNRAYLYSVFYNLLGNSIKYRSEKRTLQVDIKCYNSPEKGIVIMFSDNGSGFDMSKAKGDVFKLYKRFHKDKNGRGIGLFLVKTHLESMGGHIEVSSEVEVGTKFLIYLNKKKDLEQE